MWKSDKQLFWSYIYQYDKLCLNPSNVYDDIDLATCHDQALSAAIVSLHMEKSQVENSIEQCYIDSFVNHKNKIESRVNIIEDQEETSGILSNFAILPALVIEDYLVRGSLNTISMASSICDSMTKPPSSVCNNLPDIVDKLNSRSLDPKEEDKKGLPGSNEPENESENWLTVFFIGTFLLLGSATLLIFMALLAKKLLAKNMHRYINSEVNSNVQDYIKMRSEENPSKTSDTSLNQI